MKAMMKHAVAAALLVTVVAGCGKKAGTAVSVAVAADTKVQPKAPPAKAEPASGFAFPSDQGGKLLSTILPAESTSSAVPAVQSKPRPIAGPAALEKPDIRVPFDTPNPVLPQVKAKDDPKKKLKPRMLASDPPLSRQAYDITPRRESMPTSPLTRVSDPDVERMQPIPTLAPALPDRASLEDPTARFSLGAVLVTTAPERPNPTPPWFLNLPDPFEHHRVARIQALPPEDSLPSR